MLGPFGDQPFLARGDLGALAPLDLVAAPLVPGMDPREDEPGGDRLPVRAVTEGDGLRAGRPEPIDQLADPLGFAVRAQPGRPCPTLDLSARHPDTGPLLE